MPTAKHIEAQKRRDRRERERVARKADRERLRQLRAHIRAAAVHARQRRREVILLCKRGRVHARQRAQELRAAACAALLASIDAERQKSRKACETQTIQARTKNVDSLARAHATFTAEAKHQRTMRVWSKPQRSVVARARRADTIHESDSEVVANIPADLVPVWKAMRTKIKATPRRTRTEAFIEWAHDHPGEVLRIVDAQILKDVDALVAEEARLRREVAKPSTYSRSCDAGLAARSGAYLGASEVPF
jgi:hypothetical protein